MRHLRQAERRMQCALQLRNIVGVGRFAQHMQGCRFMRMGLADFGPGRGIRPHRRNF